MSFMDDVKKKMTNVVSDIQENGGLYMQSIKNVASATKDAVRAASDNVDEVKAAARIQGGEYAAEFETLYEKFTNHIAMYHKGIQDVEPSPHLALMAPHALLGLIDHEGIQDDDIAQELRAFCLKVDDQCFEIKGSHALNRLAKFLTPPDTTKEAAVAPEKKSEDADKDDVKEGLVGEAIEGRDKD